MQMTGMRWPLVAAAVLVGLGAAAGLPRAQTAYKIEPDDEIKIEVWEKPELTRASTVLSDGTVTLPLIGEVRVAGSTPSELEEELARKFSLYDRQITAVSIAVTAYNSKSIFVLGEVAKPGKYARWPMPTLWDLLREAGGPTESAYLGGVQVIRKGATGERNITTVDLNQIWGRGVPTNLPELEPDDTVIVPKKVVEQTWPNVIYVLGAVKTPGVYQKEAAIDLVGALLLAGGPSAAADMRKVTIVRRGPNSPRTIEVNVENFLHEGDEVSNPLLVAGDTITVTAHGPRLMGMSTVRAVATIISAAAAAALLIDRVNN
jgi:polysaccharide export outer membrane protein